MAQGHEHCFFCDNLTGRAGAGDGSIYTDEGTGPFCEDCWDNFGSIVTERDALKGEIDLLVKRIKKLESGDYDDLRTVGEQKAQQLSLAVVQISKDGKRIGELGAERDALKEILKKVEWVGGVDYVNKYCPLCLCAWPGHMENCNLGKEIR